MRIPPYSKIVAFDPGLEYTGMATSENGAFTVGTIVPDREIYGFRKVANMAYKITSTISEKSVVISEDYGYGGRFMNVLVAELMGVIKTGLLDIGNLWFLTFAPNTIKRIATGSGKATKAQVKKAMKTTAQGLGLLLEDSHQADALAILHTYFKYISGEMDSKTMRAIDARIWRI